MAVLPATPIVKINLTQGAPFDQVMILGTGILGTAQLSNTLPVIVDISSSVLKISTRRERNLLQDKYLSAQATIRINDPNGDWNPQNTSSPYYPNLVPLRKVQITVIYGATTYYIFTGYIAEYQYTYPKNFETGFVDLICYDAFRLFYNTNVNVISGATAGQDTGTRITTILNQIGWPASSRSIQSGQTTCQADPGGIRTSLAALQTVEFTEQGAFYVDKRGYATFKNRNFVYNAQSATPTKFSNATGSTDIPYFNIEFHHDDKTIVNQASVTRIGGTTQTYSDTTSINSYFTHSITADQQLMQTDANALALATAYVTSRKDTTIRIDSITLDLVTLNYTNGVSAALGLDYFDTMQITNVGQDGTTTIKTLQYQGIAHDITPNSWIAKITTQEPLLDVNY